MGTGTRVWASFMQALSRGMARSLSPITLRYIMPSLHPPSHVSCSDQACFLRLGL